MERDNKGRFVSNTRASDLLGRQVLSLLAGMQFAGDRDIDTTLGYTKAPTLDNYLAMYNRRGIAASIVDAPAKTTWRKTPIISDGSEGKSEFSKAWEALCARVNVFDYMGRVDRLTGIGRYGILLVGTKKGKLSDPLDTLTDRGAIIFLSSFSEASARVKEFIVDVHDRRFGQPSTYIIDLGGDIAPEHKTEEVHWSRVIHVAEGLLENEVYGEPRLQKVYNRLEDLDKIVGSSAEGYWQAVVKGYAVSPKEGFTISPGAVEAAKEEWQKYIHGLQRIIATEGFDFKEMKGEMVDPTTAFDVVMSIISGTKGIPKRILLGSEVGSLASTQDQANWLGRVAERQKQFAEPRILRAFIDRLIEYHALPPPTGGEYIVEWPGLFYLTDAELAKVHALNASAVRNMIGKDGDPRNLLTMAEQRIMLGLPAEMEEDGTDG